jgi:hypothetical protein
VASAATPSAGARVRPLAAAVRVVLASSDATTTWPRTRHHTLLKILFIELSSLNARRPRWRPARSAKLVTFFL